jgi:hypothetical protein
MAVDVVGYSRLISQADRWPDQGHRVETAEPLIAHHGRVVKLTARRGWSSSRAPSTPSDAVVISRHDRARTPARTGASATASYQHRRHRVEDGDIFGDGVNVAARSRASPGRQHLHRPQHLQSGGGKTRPRVRPMGEHRVKNIAKPITVYRVLPNQAEQRQDRSAWHRRIDRR